MSGKSKFKGKKLLILGSSTMARELTVYARENGAHTIVTDYLDPVQSVAKQYADEYWMISTADTDALIQKVRAEHIDAVFAGISEFNLLQAEKISVSLHLPFYFTKKQWDSIARKDLFRKLCRECSVPTPVTYFAGDVSAFGKSDAARIRYPAIVKPVDCSASRGISLCSSEDELKAGIRKAAGCSASGRIIIEEVVRGREFTAHYTVFHGRAALVCMDNRYEAALHEGMVTTVPLARIYPSLFLESYRRQADPAVRRLCESIGLENAVLFIQGMYQEETDQFYIFEAGLRSAAEAPCRFLEKVTGQNHLKMLLDMALTGESGYVQEKETPDLDGKCCGVVSFASAGGTVDRIEGLEETVLQMDCVIDVENRYPPGTTVPSGDTLRQLALRFVMVCESRRAMADNIARLNSHIRILDTDGEPMQVTLDPERILS